MHHFVCETGTKAINVITNLLHKTNLNELNAANIKKFKELIEPQ